MVVKKDSDNRN